MSTSIASRPFFRIAVGSFLLIWFLATLSLIGNRHEQQWYHSSVQSIKSWTSNITSSTQESETNGEGNAQPISYRLDLPPKIGCEALVTSLQERLITAYAELLRGIRYVNIWGYLETENKGDAAIWAAQQILLSMMGIHTEMACRFLFACDVDHFENFLEQHKPHAGIIMAGGGNFNDHYWEDQPSRIAMIEKFKKWPVRAFPQSVYMTHEDRINKTQVSFREHPNLQLAARDQPSYDWLANNLNQKALGEGSQKIKSVLVPDIAFMWGSRPDFRTKTKKLYDLVILARDDQEISAGDAMQNIPFGTGFLDLGGDVGNVSYWKFDWKFTHTYGIDREIPFKINGKVQEEMPKVSDVLTPMPQHEEGNEEEEDKKEHKEHDDDDEHEDDHGDHGDHGKKSDDKQQSGRKQKRDFRTMEAKSEFVEHKELGPNQRAWAKAEQGFRELASGRFLITDRLHGHILSTIIGLPHVLMDSKLGKNVNFHDTWTKDCQCVRVATDFEKSLEVAKMYFESEAAQKDMLD